MAELVGTQAEMFAAQRSHWFEAVRAECDTQWNLDAKTEYHVRAFEWGDPEKANIRRVVFHHKGFTAGIEVDYLLDANPKDVATEVVQAALALLGRHRRFTEE